MMRALLVGLALAACSSQTTHQVEIRGMQFVPAELAVAVGDVVEWTNADLVPHTVTAAGSFDSRSLATGQRWRYTVAKPGALVYSCTFHPTMTAKLVAR